MPAKKTTNKASGNGATLGIASQLWLAAPKLRGHLDAAEYKKVVLGLFFLFIRVEFIDNAMFVG